MHLLQKFLEGLLVVVDLVTLMNKAWVVMFGGIMVLHEYYAPITLHQVSLLYIGIGEDKGHTLQTIILLQNPLLKYYAH